MTAKGYLGLAFSIAMAFGVTACLETPKPFIETQAAATDHDMTGGDGTGNNPDTTPAGAGHDYVMNRWAAATVIATDTISETNNFIFHDMKFVSTTSGNGILLRDIHTQATNTALSYFNATDSTWTTTTPLPTDQASSEVDISLTRDASTNNIIATWSYQDKVYVNTFMADSAQWMSATELGAGKSAKIMIDSTGNQYIFTYTTMTSGYAFGMYNKPQAGSWSTTATESHRMGSDTATKTLVTSSITLNKDNNPVLAFIEKTGTDNSLNTIRFAGGAWATSVDAVDTATNAINLTQITALEIRADNTGNEIIVLGTGANTQKHIYQSIRSSGANWQTASRLDIDKANIHIESGPLVTQSHDGKLFVAWTEHDTTPAPVVTATTDTTAADPHAGHKLSSYKSSSYGSTSYKIATRDGTGGIQKVLARMLNGTSWGSESLLSTAARDSVITALSINTGHEGTPMAMWTENSPAVTGTPAETRILSSHYMTGASGSAWMQKELVKSIPGATAQINKTYAYISPTGNGITLWSESIPASTGGTDFKINLALSSIAVSSHIEQPDTTPGTNPDPDDDTSTTPPSTLWSTPVEEATFQRSASSYYEGPELFIDNNDNRIIFVSQSEILNIGSNVPATINNTILQSSNNGPWQDVLTGQDFLQDLEPNKPIRFEQFKMVHSTNTLIGLLNDTSRYYVVYYNPSVGWSKSIIPNTFPVQSLPKLHVDSNGMATVINQSNSSNTPGIVVTAMHFMTPGGAPQVRSIAIASTINLLDHGLSATSDGTIHIGWIDATHQNANRLHTARYTPGGDWAQDIEAQTLDLGILNQKTTHYSVTSGGKEIFILNDLSQKKLKSSVRNADKTWTSMTDIISSFAPIGTPKIVNSDSQNFMLVWQQQMKMTMNGETMYINQFHTTFFDALTSIWSTPTIIGSDTHGQQSTVSIIMHDDSTATAAWIDRNGQTTSVYSSSFNSASGWGESQMLASYAGGAEGMVTRLKVAHNYTGTVAVIWDSNVFSSLYEHTIRISKQL